MNKFWKKNHYFIKLECILLLITVLPIALLGKWTVNSLEKVIVKHFLDLNNEYAGQSMKSFEVLLDNMENISGQIYHNKVVNNLLAKNQITDPFEKKELMDIVSAIENSSSFIDNVYLYVEKSRVMVTSLRGYEPIEEFKDTFFLDWYNRGDKNYMVTQTRLSPYSKDGGEASIFSIITKLPLYNKTGKKSYGAIIINTKQDSLSALIPIGEQNDFYVAKEDGKIMFSSDNSMVGKTIQTLEDVNIDSTAKSGSYLSTDKNHRKMIVYSWLEDYQWYFITCYPYENEAEILSWMTSLMWFIGAMLIAASTFMALLMFRNNIHSIQNLQEFLMERRKRTTAHCKGYRKEDNSISGLISEVLSYQEGLEKKLDQSLLVYKEVNYRDLVLKGRMRDETNHLPFPGDQLFFILMEINEYEALLEEEDYDDNQYKIQILYWIEKELFYSVRGICVQLESSQMAIMVSAKDIDEELLEGQLNLLQNKFYEKEQFHTIIFHDQVISEHDLKESCGLCREMLLYRFSHDDGKILKTSRFDRYHSSGDDFYTYPKEEVGFLVTYIKSCERNNALHMLHDILEKLYKNNTKLFRQYTLLTMWNEILTISKETEVQIKKKMEEEHWTILTQITSLKSIRTVETSFSHMIDIVIEDLRLKKNQKVDDYVAVIMKYIDNNYQTQITLEDVCREVHLSPTYVCKVLKQVERKTFSRTLNERRIKEACKLLRESSNVKISDIAQQTGFTSANYFIKVFKDLMDMTPGDYKENNEK